MAVDDVASKLTRLIERPGRPGVFNVCSGAPTSIRRLVETHVAKRGARIALNLGHYAYPDHEPMAFWGDARKLALAHRASPISTLPQLRSIKIDLYEAA